MNSKIFEFKVNHHLIYGENSLNLLSEKLNELNFLNLGIIVDKNLLNFSQVVKNQLNQLTSNYKCIIHEYELNFEPTYNYLDKIILLFKNSFQTLDCMIGFGGGSVMDTTKAIAVMYNNDGPSINFKGFPKQINKPLPVILIPSTTGTGSEVVFNASVIDESSKIKMGVNYEKNYPILSILDPKVVSKAPLSVIVSSTFDSLVHSFETFMSPINNEITKIYSNEAIRRIFVSFPKVIKGEHTINDWSNLQLAAYLAIIGLTNTSSGVIGALSYHLGTNYSVPHGMAGAFFLQKIIRYNHEKGYHKFAELFNFIPLNSYSENSVKNRSERVVDYLEKISDLAKIPKSLKYYGINNNEIEDFLKFFVNAEKQMKNNPININKEDLVILLNSEDKIFFNLNN